MAAAPRLYTLLGVEKTSSVEDIKKAYRTLARTHHPDKNLNDPGAAQKFQEIQYAYSILSDESKRAIYDMHGESAARKFDEQGRNSHTVFSPNPLLARRIWIFFFGFWLLCVLLDPFIGVPLEWVLITFGLPLTFLYFFGRKNFPWRFMWCLVVDFLLYFIVPSAVLARLANILIYAACVITISLLGADPAFAAGSIMILGYIDVFWRTVPLNGMFMAAHSTTAGAVVLLAIAMMLSEEGAHKYMVDVAQYFLPLTSFVAWWLVLFLDWLLPWLGPWEWLPFVVFWAWAHISSIPGTNWDTLQSQLTLAGGVEIGVLVIYMIMPGWIYRYINSFVIQLIVLWLLRIFERVILVKTTGLWFYLASMLVFLQFDWSSSRVFPSYSDFYGSQLLGVLVWVSIVLMALAMKVDEEIEKAEREGVDPPSGGTPQPNTTGKAGNPPKGGAAHEKRQRKNS